MGAGPPTGPSWSPWSQESASAQDRSEAEAQVGQWLAWSGGARDGETRQRLGGGAEGGLFTPGFGFSSCSEEEKEPGKAGPPAVTEETQAQRPGG